jgi:hypothetical protein
MANKTRLGQLYRVIGMKVEQALKRRRRADMAVQKRAMAENGKGLQRGEGGQSILSFGRKKEEVQEETTGDTTIGDA